MFAPNQYDIEQDRRDRFINAADNERLARIAQGQENHSYSYSAAILNRVGQQLISLGQRLQEANKDANALESGARPAYPAR